MHKKAMANVFATYSRLIILVFLFVFFSLATESFWSLTNWGNISNIILQQAPFTILLALCMTMAIILKGFDLSLGSSVALISCVTGYILKWTYNPLYAIFGALLLGGIIGTTNGILIAKVKVPPFIATFSMKWILRGIALVILGGRQIYEFGPRFRSIFISNQFTFFMITFVICAVMLFVFKKTVFGKYMYATGTNVEAAKISGIRTDFVYIITYVASGIILGIVSVMYLANLGTAEPVIGENFALTAIAASLVGGTSVTGGRGGVYNAVVGGIIMLFLTNGMIQMGVPSVWQQVVIGGVIIVSIMLERLFEKFSSQ